MFLLYRPTQRPFLHAYYVGTALDMYFRGLNNAMERSIVVVVVNVIWVRSVGIALILQRP